MDRSGVRAISSKTAAGGYGKVPARDLKVLSSSGTSVSRCIVTFVDERSNGRTSPASETRTTRWLQAIAVAHSDSQVWLARHWVNGHAVHHQAFRRYAQCSGDLLVNRLEEEGVERRRCLALFGLEGEDGTELVVAQEEDPVLDDLGVRNDTLMSNSEEDDLAPVLGAAGRALTATMMAKVADCGFSDVTPAFASLLLLVDATGARATTLAQQAGITKQAVSQLVRELEARDYVEQVPDPTDTRAKIVRLTEKGVTLKTACSGARQELQSIAIAKLGKSRVAHLRRDLIELSAALEELRTR